MPAALFMSMVRALLRNFAEREADPGIILRDLNNAVGSTESFKCNFVTVSFFCFRSWIADPRGLLSGHPPP